MDFYLSAWFDGDESQELDVQWFSGNTLELVLMAVGLLGWLGKTVYRMIRKGAGEMSYEE